MLAAAHAGHAAQAAQAAQATQITQTAHLPQATNSPAQAANASAPTTRIPEQRAGKHGGSHRPSSHGGHVGHLAAKPILAVVALVAVGGIGLAAKFAVDSGKPSTSPPPNSIIASGSPGSTSAGVVSLPSASATTAATTSPSAKPSATPTPSHAPTTKPPANPAPTTKPPAPTSAPAGNQNQATAVQQVFALINQTRVQAGLPAYTITSGLTQSATTHNNTMASGCGLSHQCPGEADLGTRETAAGVQWSAAGENIGDGGPVDNNDSSIAQMAVSLTQSMINEQPPDDGHRKNILSTSFHHIGISVFRDSSGTVWMTQDFSN